MKTTPTWVGFHVWKGIEHENTPRMGGFRAGRVWKVSNTETTYVEVDSVLGMCERASNTKTTPTQVVSMLSVCGRASNTKTTYIEVVSMPGVCRKALNMKAHPRRVVSVLGACSVCVEGQWWCFFVSHYHFDAMRGNDPTHRVETAMTRRERTTGTTCGPLSSLIIPVNYRSIISELKKQRKKRKAGVPLRPRS
jgi:hypothetical protein